MIDGHAINNYLIHFGREKRETLRNFGDLIIFLLQSR